MVKNIRRFGYGLSALAVAFGAITIVPPHSARALTLTEDMILEEDITDGILVEAGSTVNLDLNGHSVTNTAANMAAIINRGNLTITDSSEDEGTVSTTQNGTAAVTNYPGATMTIAGGTYTSAKWYILRNYGTMTIEGGVVTANEATSTNASMVTNGWVGSTDMNNGAGIAAADREGEPELTINGGVFTAGTTNCSVIKNDDYGSLNITSGIFTQPEGSLDTCDTVILNWHRATISGGVYYSENGPVISNGAYTGDSDLGEIEIAGGTFTIGENGTVLGYGLGGNGTGLMSVYDGWFDTALTTMPVNEGTANNGRYYDIVITGGHYDTAFAEADLGLIADGYVVVPDEDGYLVDELSAEAEAVALEVGETYDLAANIAVYPENYEGAWVYESDDTDIATVSDAGVITAVAASDDVAIITVTDTATGYSFDVEVEVVPVSLTDITLGATTFNMDIGDYATTSITYTPADFDFATITGFYCEPTSENYEEDYIAECYFEYDEELEQVDINTLVLYGYQAGTVNYTIRITDGNGNTVSTTFDVTVNDALKRSGDWTSDAEMNFYGVMAEFEEPVVGGSYIEAEVVELPEEVLEGEENLKVLFEVTVKDEDGNTIPVSGNEIEITLQIDENVFEEEYEYFQIVYIDEDGNIAEYFDPIEVVHEYGMYYITFRTTHLSSYGVLASSTAFESAATLNAALALHAADTGVFTEPVAGARASDASTEVMVAVVALSAVVLAGAAVFAKRK